MADDLATLKASHAQLEKRLDAELQAHADTKAAHQKLREDHAKALQEKDAAHAKVLADTKERHKADLEAAEKKILSEHPIIAAKRAKLKELADKHAAETKAAHEEIMASVKG